MALFNKKRKKEKKTRLIGGGEKDSGSRISLGKGGGDTGKSSEKIKKNNNEVSKFLVAGGEGIKKVKTGSGTRYEYGGKFINLKEGENLRKVETGKGIEYRKSTEEEVKTPNRTPLAVERSQQTQAKLEAQGRETRGEPSIEEIKNFDKAKENVIEDKSFNSDNLPLLDGDSETLLGSEKLYEIAANPKTAIALGFGILTLVTAGGAAIASGAGGAAAAGATAGGRAVITRTAYQGAKSVFTQRAFTGAASRAGVQKLFTMSGRAAASKGLQKLGLAGTKNLLLKRGFVIGGSVISANVLMAWFASDNILSGSSIYARDVGGLVEEGTMTAEEGLAYLDQVESWQNLAKGNVQVAGKYNPLMRPYAEELAANGELGTAAINLQRQKILYTGGGGVQ